MMPRLSELMPHKTCRTGASSCFKTCSQRRKLDGIYMRQSPATRQCKLPKSECCKYAVNKTALLPGMPQKAMQARNSCRMRVFGKPPCRKERCKPETKAACVCLETATLLPTLPRILLDSRGDSRVWGCALRPSHPHSEPRPLHISAALRQRLHTGIQHTGITQRLLS